jgi:sn-glycerol 3-phosphate transport system substrate-binding protein
LARRHFRVPVTRAAIDVLDADGWYRKHPDHRVATTLLDSTLGSPAVLGPLLGGDADIMAELTGAMHDVLIAGAEPAARFELATVRAQQILTAYNSYCVGPPRRTPRPRDFAIPGLI